MSSNNLQTFECTTCNQHHTLHPDALPLGHSGHKPHCLFCLARTLYRTTIPVKPTPRLTPEENEKKNIIRTRKAVIGIIIPIFVLSALAFRWEMHYWDRIAKVFEQSTGLWKDRLLWLTLCMASLLPSACVVGFLASVAYYSVLSIKKKTAKRSKASDDSRAGDATPPVPVEEKQLVELQYQDLREINEPIQIVVTPPESPPRTPLLPPRKASRVSRLLAPVTDRFKSGYDGRHARRESWRSVLEAADEVRDKRDSDGVGVGGSGRVSRPFTEWPLV